MHLQLHRRLPPVFDSLHIEPEPAPACASSLCIFCISASSWPLSRGLCHFYWPGPPASACACAEPGTAAQPPYSTSRAGHTSGSHSARTYAGPRRLRGRRVESASTTPGRTNPRPALQRGSASASICIDTFPSLYRPGEPRLDAHDPGVTHPVLPVFLVVLFLPSHDVRIAAYLLDPRFSGLALPRFILLRSLSPSSVPCAWTRQHERPASQALPYANTHEKPERPACMHALMCCPLQSVRPSWATPPSLATPHVPEKFESETPSSPTNPQPHEMEWDKTSRGIHPDPSGSARTSATLHSSSPRRQRLTSVSLRLSTWPLPPRAPSHGASRQHSSVFFQ